MSLNPKNFYWPNLYYAAEQSSTSAEFLVGKERLKNFQDGRMYSPKELGLEMWLQTIKGRPTPPHEKKCLQFRRFSYEDYTDEANTIFKTYAKQMESVA